VWHGRVCIGLPRNCSSKYRGENGSGLRDGKPAEDRHHTAESTLGQWIFVSNSLADGRTFRALAIIDHYTRECPTIEVDQNLPGARVLRVLEQLAEERGLPEAMQVDRYGPEFLLRNGSAMVRAKASTRRLHRVWAIDAKPLRGILHPFGRFREELFSAHAKPQFSALLL
jgi:transposase InsO family protein